VQEGSKVDIAEEGQMWRTSVGAVARGLETSAHCSPGATRRNTPGHIVPWVRTFKAQFEGDSSRRILRFKTPLIPHPAITQDTMSNRSILDLLWERACVVVSNADRYVITGKSQDYIFKILLVTTGRWEIQIYLHRISLPSGSPYKV
jgi:hypothetical protein